MDKFDEHLKFESEIVSDNPSQIEGIKNGEDLSQHIIGIKMGEILRSEKNWTARIKFFEDFIENRKLSHLKKEFDNLSKLRMNIGKKQLSNDEFRKKWFEIRQKIRDEDKKIRVGKQYFPKLEKENIFNSDFNTNDDEISIEIVQRPGKNLKNLLSLDFNLKEVILFDPLKMEKSILRICNNGKKIPLEEEIMWSLDELGKIRQKINPENKDLIIDLGECEDLVIESSKNTEIKIYSSSLEYPIGNIELKFPSNRVIETKMYGKEEYGFDFVEWLSERKNNIEMKYMIWFVDGFGDYYIHHNHNKEVFSTTLKLQNPSKSRYTCILNKNEFRFSKFFEIIPINFNITEFKIKNFEEIANVNKTNFEIDDKKIILKKFGGKNEIINFNEIIDGFVTGNFSYITIEWDGNNGYVEKEYSHDLKNSTHFNILNSKLNTMINDNNYEILGELPIYLGVRKGKSIARFKSKIQQPKDLIKVKKLGWVKDIKQEGEVWWIYFELDIRNVMSQDSQGHYLYMFNNHATMPINQYSEVLDKLVIKFKIPSPKSCFTDSKLYAISNQLDFCELPIQAECKDIEEGGKRWYSIVSIPLKADDIFSQRWENVTLKYGGMHLLSDPEWDDEIKKDEDFNLDDYETKFADKKRIACSKKWDLKRIISGNKVYYVLGEKELRESIKYSKRDIAFSQGNEYEKNKITGKFQQKKSLYDDWIDWNFNLEYKWNGKIYSNCIYNRPKPNYWREIDVGRPLSPHCLKGEVEEENGWHSKSKLNLISKDRLISETSLKEQKNTKIEEIVVKKILPKENRPVLESVDEKVIKISKNKGKTERKRLAKQLKNSERGRRKKVPLPPSEKDRTKSDKFKKSLQVDDSTLGLESKKESDRIRKLLEKSKQKYR